MSNCNDDGEFVSSMRDVGESDEIGHLGRLAQMCARYCREFDDVIDSAAASVNSNGERGQLDRNLDYLNRGFKDLKRKFRENEMIRLQSSSSSSGAGTGGGGGMKRAVGMKSHESDSESESGSGSSIKKVRKDYFFDYKII